MFSFSTSSLLVRVQQSTPFSYECSEVLSFGTSRGPNRKSLTKVNWSSLAKEQKRSPLTQSITCKGMCLLLCQVVIIINNFGPFTIFKSLNWLPFSLYNYFHFLFLYFLLQPPLLCYSCSLLPLPVSLPFCLNNYCCSHLKLSSGFVFVISTFRILFIPIMHEQTTRPGVSPGLYIKSKCHLLTHSSRNIIHNRTYSD